METTALVLRAIVMVGAVIFAFGLLGSGFYFVLREYRLIRSFESLKEFVQLTESTSLDVDLTKQTLSLARTRPGILMMSLGALILLACIFQPLEIHEKTSNTSSATRPNSDTATPIDGPQTQPQLRPITTHDLWLGNLESLRQANPHTIGVSLGQMLLPDDQLVNRAFFATEGSTLTEYAAGIYGDARFTPLLSIFNPHIASSDTAMLHGTVVNAWLTHLSPSFQSFSTERMIRVSGHDHEAVLTALLPSIEKVVFSTAFETNPSQYWNEHGGFEKFLAALRSATEIDWGQQLYVIREGDTAELIARAELGNKNLWPYLLLHPSQTETQGPTIRARTALLAQGEEIWLVRPMTPR